jgi:superfamily II DNA or RNA helicase
MEQWDRGPFLISAAPGAGKTRPALVFAQRELAAGRVSAVVIACPTAPLTRQWARAAHDLGLNLAPDVDSPRPPAGFQGVAVTYARIAKDPQKWARPIRASSPLGADGPARGAAKGTLVIADEAHHLGEELAWGESFNTAFAAAPRWLLLSGTPFRSDESPIPGVSYDSDGVAEPDIAYSYADAVKDGICRPVCFVAYDGSLSWRSGDDVIESSFETVLTTREASRRYRTAISTELPDGLPRILREADNKLRKIRAEGHADAGGLVIAADSDHARRIAAHLREVTGRVPVVVLHAEPRAAAKLVDFTNSRDPWIVAVNMVSEGVDIPRLRVGVYATAAKTPLVFRQIVGRFVRTIAGRAPEASWLYVPADPILRDHAATIETELRRVLRVKEDLGEPEFDKPDRLQTERTGALEFEPLSADVAPQMTLFGTPPPASAGTAVAPTYRPLTAEYDPEPEEEPVDETPAFERRALLRAERHRLVSELRRRDGSSHQEINAWLNRKLGIAKVDDATLAQLERSIELLIGKLTSRSRR